MVTTPFVGHKTERPRIADQQMRCVGKMWKAGVRRLYTPRTAWRRRNRENLVQAPVWWLQAIPHTDFHRLGKFRGHPLSPSCESSRRGTDRRGSRAGRETGQLSHRGSTDLLSRAYRRFQNSDGMVHR
jgi:hypothetical protein